MARPIPELRHADPIIQRLIDWLRDRLDKPLPQFSVYRAAASGAILTNAAFALVTFDTHHPDDPFDAFDLVNGRYVIPQAGLWLFTGSVTPVENLTDQSNNSLTLGVNGSTDVRRMANQTISGVNNYAIQGATMHRLAKGNYVELRYFQNAGAAKSIAGSQTASHFQGVWISS